MVTNTKVGSVVVVGSGIAGMQAALDCANAGFKVYLVEEQASIGGNMARLDKTFPTNDCAMCMISPKLVEVGRHLNIEIISYADLKKIDGKAGNFTVTVNKRSRFVDEEKCNGCGDCERECPVIMTDTFNGELAKRKAIYRMYPQAIPNVFTIDKKELPPPCRAICPAGVNAQGYVALISKGKFLDALDVDTAAGAYEADPERVLQKLEAGLGQPVLRPEPPLERPHCTSSVCCRSSPGVREDPDSQWRHSTNRSASIRPENTRSESVPEPHAI